MVKQQDLNDLVQALNQVLDGFDKRIKKLEEAAEKPSSPPRRKKVEENT
jgi:hypothetical protein